VVFKAGVNLAEKLMRWAETGLRMSYVLFPPTSPIGIRKTLHFFANGRISITKRKWEKGSVATALRILQTKTFSIVTGANTALRKRRPYRRPNWCLGRARACAMPFVRLAESKMF
jgi:hypothetical protein